MRSKKQRYVFRSDDDGHYFLIPKDKAKTFSELMQHGYKTDDWEKFEDEFSDCRINSYRQFSFTDPQEDA